MPPDKQVVGSAYLYDDQAFQGMDNLVAWASEVGLYVILDMHCAPGAQNTLIISDSDGTAHL